jgi:hypothetical protein
LHVPVEEVGDGRGHIFHVTPVRNTARRGVIENTHEQVAHVLRGHAVFHGYDPVLAVGCLLQDDPGWVTGTLGKLVTPGGFEVGHILEVELVQDVQ